MPIAIACPHCDWKGRVKDELAGKKGKCPTCGELVPIPNTPGLPSKRSSVDDAPDVVDEADFVEESPRPRGKPKSKSLDEAFRSVGRDDDDRPRARRRDEDDDDDRPRGRRRDDDEDDDRPRRRRPADDEDEDRPARSRRRDDDDDDRPRRRPSDGDDDEDERPSRSRRRPADNDDDDDSPRSKRRRSGDDRGASKRRRKKARQRQAGFNKRVGAIVGGIIGLVLGLILLAVVFLVRDRISIYGIIVVVISIIGLFQGITGAGLGGSDDDDDGGDD